MSEPKKPTIDPSDFLKFIPLFKDLKPQERRTLADAFMPKNYSAAARIAHEGEKSDLFFVIVSGYVNITRGAVFMTTLNPGETFGEAALVRDSVRIANVDASNNVELRAISRPAFELFMDAHPEASRKILMALVEQLFSRLERTSRELQFERNSGMKQSDIDKLFS